MVKASWQNTQRLVTSQIWQSWLQKHDKWTRQNSCTNCIPLKSSPRLQKQVVTIMHITLINLTCSICIFKNSVAPRVAYLTCRIRMVNKQIIQWGASYANPGASLGPWQRTLEMAQGGLHNNLGGNLLCSLMDLTQSDFLSPGTDMEGQLMLKAYRAMKKLR